MKKLAMFSFAVLSLSLAACGKPSFCEESVECACQDNDACDRKLLMEQCDKITASCQKEQDNFYDCFKMECKNGKLEAGDMTGGAITCTAATLEYATCSAEALLTK